MTFMVVIGVVVVALAVVLRLVRAENQSADTEQSDLDRPHDNEQG